MKLLKAQLNPQVGGEEFKCYIIWQMMHSNEQQRSKKKEAGSVVVEF